MHLSVINSSTIVVTWEPLTQNNILGYKLYYRCGSESLNGPVVHVKEANTQILTNLTPNKLCTILIQGFDENGDGKFSNKSVVTNDPDNHPFESNEALEKMKLKAATRWLHPLIPRPPQNVTISLVNPTCLRMTWNAPERSKTSDDFQIVRYTVKYSAILPSHPAGPNVTLNKFKQSDQTHLVITDLRPHTPYEFQVRSHTRLRAGRYSSKILQVMPEDIPSCPVSVIWSSKSTTSGKVEWQPPLHTNGELTKYTVHYQLQMPGALNGEVPLWSEESVLPRQNWMILRDLRPHSNYIIKVSASNSAGQCDPFESLSVWTPEAGCIPCNDIQKLRYTSGVPCPGCIVNVLPTEVAAVETKGITEQPLPELRHSSLGMAIGIAAGLACIILCLIVVSLRSKFFPPTFAEYHQPSKQDRHALGTSVHSDFMRANSAASKNAKYISGLRNCAFMNGQSHLNVNYVHDAKLLATLGLPPSGCHCQVNPFYSWTPDSPYIFGNAASIEHIKTHRVSETDTNSSDSGYKCGMAPMSKNYLCTDVSTFMGMECLRKSAYDGERQTALFEVPANKSEFSIQRESLFITPGNNMEFALLQENVHDDSPLIHMCGRCGKERDNLRCKDRKLDTSAPPSTSGSGDGISAFHVPSGSSQVKTVERKHLTSGGGAAMSRSCFFDTKPSGKAKEFSADEETKRTDDMPLLISYKV